MEKMTTSELQMLKNLQAKQKRVQRAEMEFWRHVEEEKSDILSRLLSDVVAKYGCTIDELIDYIKSDRQVEYYRRTHHVDEITDTDDEVDYEA